MSSRSRDKHKRASKGINLRGSRTRQLSGGSDEYENDRMSAEHELNTEGRVKGAHGARKSESTGARRPAEYEEDSGRTGSQEFLHFVRTSTMKKDAAKRTSKYMAAFKKSVQIQEGNLTDHLTVKETRAVTMDAGFLEDFEMLYKAATDSATLETLTSAQSHPHTVATSNLQHASLRVVSASHSLIDHFEQDNVVLTSQGVLSTLDTSIEADTQQLQHVLDLGRLISVKKVEKILNNSSEEFTTPGTRQASDLLFGGNSGQEDDTTWAQTAIFQEKAIKRLVQTLPEE